MTDRQALGGLRDSRLTPAGRLEWYRERAAHLTSMNPDPDVEAALSATLERIEILERIVSEQDQSA